MHSNLAQLTWWFVAFSILSQTVLIPHHLPPVSPESLLTPFSTLQREAIPFDLMDLHSSSTNLKTLLEFSHSSPQSVEDLIGLSQNRIDAVHCSNYFPQSVPPAHSHQS